MPIDFAALEKASKQHADKDTVKFPVGQTLMGLIGAKVDFPTGLGGVRVEVYSQKNHGPNHVFGRSVVTYDQAFCRLPEYQARLSFPVPEECPIKTWVGTLPASERKLAEKLTPIVLWCVVPLAERKNPKDPWQPIYTKPKMMTAKYGGKTTHLQTEIERLVVETETAKIQAVFDPDRTQLLVVKRTGSGFNDTVYTIELATGSDPNFGDLTAFEWSDELKNDLEIATRSGGPCDPIAMIASMFSPTPDEIATKLKAGSSEAPASRPKLEED
jgi:hypothetical protein